MGYIDSIQEDKIYLQNLEQRRLLRPLKVPANLAGKILSDRFLMRSVCMYLELKPLFYNGELYNAKKRHAAIAAYLCMGKSSYRYKIMHLERIGLVRFDESGTMFLASWKQFFRIYGIERPGRFRFYRLKNQYVNSEHLIRRFAIEENLKKQAYEIEQKIFEGELKQDRQDPILRQIDQVDRAKIAKEDKQRLRLPLIEKLERLERHDYRGEKSLIKKLKRSGLMNCWYNRAERNYYRRLYEFDAWHDINLDESISCQKTADLFGITSKSGGYYWQRRLAQIGLMEIESRAVLLDESEPQLHRLYYESSRGHLNLHHFVGQKGIWKRLNNRFHFSNLAYI
jgi:hypothetical protein